MSIRFDISNDEFCIREPLGLYGTWRIKRGKEGYLTEYAVYVSVRKYNELVRGLRESLVELESLLTKEHVEDFIEDVTEAQEPLALGGVVAYFLPSRQAYKLKHTGTVRRITRITEES